MAADSSISMPQPGFATNYAAADLPPQVQIICEILATSPLHEVESRLAATLMKPTPEIIQRVLKSSYSTPSTAAKFFRWSGLAEKHTPYSWNLMVDLLGKNQLFEPMWDAIRSMKKEGLLSLTTFVSVFENYCVAGRFDEAVMTFEVMGRLGLAHLCLLTILVLPSVLKYVIHFLSDYYLYKFFKHSHTIKNTVLLMVKHVPGIARNVVLNNGGSIFYELRRMGWPIASS